MKKKKKKETILELESYKLILIFPWISKLSSWFFILRPFVSDTSGRINRHVF